MDRHHIRDTQVIERYLNGKLSAAEEQAFEEAYLADPELLAELKLAERLREGFKDLPREERAPTPARPRWYEVTGSPRYGIAASFVAAAALAASATLFVRDQVGPGEGASPALVVPLVTVRGGGNPNTVRAPAPNEWTVLLLDTGFGDYDRYRATLVRAGGEEVLSLDGLTPSADGTVAVGFPGRWLAGGDYEVRLEAGRRDWPADRRLDELTRTPLTVTPSR